MLLHFVPKGYRAWAVERDNVVIAAIADSARGLVLTVDSAGLNVSEMSAIAGFMHSRAEDAVEQVRRQVPR